LTLRVVEGRPYHEVAEHLSCSVETARARVSRGLRRLARVLDVPQPEMELER
jgi:DNA-directed RNA polymerase specialized sigma24 family protein